jgi:hypothetical protein
MALTPSEAQAAYDKLTDRLDDLAIALKPDDDGKVRLTRAELSKVTSGLLTDVIAFVVDVVD